MGRGLKTWPFRCFEAGLLNLYYERFRFDLDLHALLDFFVIGGMMSPCPHRSLRTGLSFYEVSPVLFWGQPDQRRILIPKSLYRQPEC
ncbi:MAG: hypothetical protein A2464_13640 [Deltaproteobacteria bacterium RIFOXYC2_FULL_48_10]|nr:MAG: hypothetical protein A2464_13640 [Deltaproteobacteria bacterium RIFOXYC2_FULL_48_10]